MRKLLPILVLFFIFSCKKEEPAIQPVEIGVNGDLESNPSFGSGWWMYAASTFDVAWTSEQASSGSKSIMISTAVSDSQQFAYWGEQICSNVPIGKKITLKVKVKANLVGTGISLALRADGADTNAPALRFVSTQEYKSIPGTFDWQEFSVEMSSVPNGTACLYVFLVYLQNTTGEVYFDDVSLVYQ